MNSHDAIHYRLDRIELALELVQRHIGYFGLCVNHSLHPGLIHPHWDDRPETMEQMDRIRRDMRDQAKQPPEKEQETRNAQKGLRYPVTICHKAHRNSNTTDRAQ